MYFVTRRDQSHNGSGGSGGSRCRRDRFVYTKVITVTSSNASLLGSSGQD
jgi:hypothetical protein